MPGAERLDLKEQKISKRVIYRLIVQEDICSASWYVSTITVKSCIGQLRETELEG